MNILQGIVSAVQVHGNLSLLHLLVGKIPLKALVIESPGQQARLREGSEVEVMFKETEVIIGSKEEHNISLQNRFHCVILQIEKGKLLSHLILQYPEGRIGSIITTAAVEQLDLQEGKEVIAMVKTTELMIRGISG
jgi:molybdate transport system regulatory protein